MSQKNLDRHGRFRRVTIAFRVSPEENAAINERVRLSGLTKQDYLCRRSLEQDVVVVGTPRVFWALREDMCRISKRLLELNGCSEESPEFWEAVKYAARLYHDLMKFGEQETEHA